MLITLVWKSWSSDITLNRWPVFIFNVTKAVVLNTFFTAKGRISMLWGFSHIFSCQIFVSLIFCVLTTLFQILENKLLQFYKRCEAPNSFLIKRKRHQLKRPRSIVVIIIFITVVIRINTSDHLLTNFRKVSGAIKCNHITPTEVINDMTRSF